MAMPQRFPILLFALIMAAVPFIPGVPPFWIVLLDNIGLSALVAMGLVLLTGVGGLESNALNRFFDTSATAWNATGSATQVIFRAGALRAGLQLTRAQKEQMLLTYEQAIQESLREVSDSLVAYQKNLEFTKQQQLLTSAAKDAERLSNILYQHGGASFLQVLTSETNYFGAELNLAKAQLNQQLALVQVYNALGGGWQP